MGWPACPVITCPCREDSARAHTQRASGYSAPWLFPPYTFCPLFLARFSLLLYLTKIDKNFHPKAAHLRIENKITINVPLFKKMRDIIFFLRDNNFLSRFEGHFEGAKTFLIP
jgi:hypothetical protein